MTMPRHFTAILLASVLGSSTSLASSSLIEGEARRQIEATLPPHLAVIELVVPGPSFRRIPTSSLSGLPAKTSVAPALTVLWKTPPRAGTMTVELSLREGTENRRAWAHIKLAARRPILIATHALEAGIALAPDDVTTELRPCDPAAARGACLELDPRALTGARVLRAVREGDALSEDAIALPSPLARGTEVTLVVAHGGLRVSTAGVLERSARPGEETTFRVKGSNRAIRGTLIDTTTAVASEGAR